MSLARVLNCASAANAAKLPMTYAPASPCAFPSRSTSGIHCVVNQSPATSEASAARTPAR